MSAISECMQPPGSVSKAKGSLRSMKNAKQAPGIRRQEVPALTGLRFVAVFSVLLAHGVTILLANYETPLGVIYWLKQGSGFGMTLFFVLSGFVIHYNYSTLLKTKGLRGVATWLGSLVFILFLF